MQQQQQSLNSRMDRTKKMKEKTETKVEKETITRTAKVKTVKKSAEMSPKFSVYCQRIRLKRHHRHHH